MAGVPFDKDMGKRFLQRLQERMQAPRPEVAKTAEDSEEVLQKKREAVKRRQREALFDRQVDILVRVKRYHEVVGFKRSFLDKLSEYRSIIHSVGDVDISHLPFAIVVPSEIMSLEEKLRRIEYKGMYGYTVNIRRPEHLVNVSEIDAPRKPYILKDIDFGLFTRGMSPQEAEAEIRAQGRSPLTLDEGFALLTFHPEILSEHGLNLLGSRYAGNGIPAMYLHPETGPRLEYYRVADVPSIMNLGWGTPSCGGRLVL